MLGSVVLEAVVLDAAGAIEYPPRGLLEIPRSGRELFVGVFLDPAKPLAELLVEQPFLVF
jgi:hypothetical protein